MARRTHGIRRTLLVTTMPLTMMFLSGPPAAASDVGAWDYMEPNRIVELNRARDTADVTISATCTNAARRVAADGYLTQPNRAIAFDATFVCGRLNLVTFQARGASVLRPGAALLWLFFDNCDDHGCGSRGIAYRVEIVDRSPASALMATVTEVGAQIHALPATNLR